MELALHQKTTRDHEDRRRDRSIRRGRVRGALLSCAIEPNPLQYTNNQLLTPNTGEYMFKVMHHDTCVEVTNTINEAMMVVRSLEAGLYRIISHSPYTILRAE